MFGFQQANAISVLISIIQETLKSLVRHQTKLYKSSMYLELLKDTHANNRYGFHRKIKLMICHALQRMMLRILIPVITLMVY